MNKWPQSHFPNSIFLKTGILNSFCHRIPVHKHVTFKCVLAVFLSGVWYFFSPHVILSIDEKILMSYTVTNILLHVTGLCMDLLRDLTGSETYKMYGIQVL